MDGWRVDTRVKDIASQGVMVEQQRDSERLLTVCYAQSVGLTKGLPGLASKCVTRSINFPTTAVKF